MEILFFTKGDRAVASSRQRVWMLAEKLHSAYGYEYKVLSGIQYAFWDISARRFRILRNVFRNLTTRTYNLIFVHKSLFPWDVVLLILAAKVLRGKKLMYDLDDAEWVHSPVKTRLLARSADYVLCGSHVILKWASQFNKNALLVPTVLDAALYHKHAVRHMARECYTIGWVGSGMRHFKDGLFAIIKPALEKLARQGVRFRFVIIGSQNYQPLKDYFKDTLFETIFVDRIQWEDSEAVPKIIEEYQFDVGVMPQDDSAFNRAKCAFKAIEYMACGVPTVASPVGENAVVITHGVNGYLAATPDEWVELLYKLLTNEDTRAEMGKRALQTITERYSYSIILPIVKRSIELL